MCPAKTKISLRGLSVSSLSICRVLGYPRIAQQILRSAQSDLSLRLAHMSEDTMYIFPSRGHCHLYIVEWKGTLYYIQRFKHSRSLIRIFPGRILDSQGCKVSSRGQRRLWSGCVDAQADLSLRWAHMLEGSFAHITSQICSALLSSKNSHSLKEHTSSWNAADTKEK